jgi:hypothetical protein
MSDAEAIKAKGQRAIAERDEELDRSLEIVRTGSARAVRQLPDLLFQRLSPEEMKEALVLRRAIGRAEPRPRRRTRAGFAFGLLRSLWSPLGAALAGVAIGVVAPWFALAVEPAATSGSHAPIALADPSAWPACRRLSPAEDRCLYLTRSGELTWTEAAADLAMPEEALRAANPAFASADPLPAGVKLVIDRHPRLPE